MLQNQLPVVPAICSEPQSSSRRLPIPIWLLAVLLVLVTLIAYLPAFQSGFIEFDDPGYVTANSHVNTGLSWKNIKWAFSTGGYAMGIWGPVTWMSHMTDCDIYGLNPVGHHATSVALHSLCAVLLFLLLYAGTGHVWRSLIVAALFALHPLNVENVAWVAERKSILSMFFSLCTVGLYGWYARAPHWPRYLSVVVAFTLALLSKPMAVTLPFILLLLDYWPLQRLSPIDGDTDKSYKQLRLILIEKLPLLALSAVFAWIAIASEKRFGGISLNVPLYQRLENAAISTVTYIRRMVWPNDLAFYYPYRASALSWWKTLLAVLILAALTGLVYRLRRHRHLIFGWAFFLFTLLPVIGVYKLVGTVSMADRYAYVPIIGLFIAVIWELADCASNFRVPMYAQATAALLLIGSAAYCTNINAGYWRNNLTLFEHAHAVTSPPDIVVETNLAGALNDEGRLDDALVYYRNAEALAPATFNAHYNIGYTLARKGDHSAAAGEFQQALRYANNTAQKTRGLNSLSIAYLNLDARPQALATLTELLALQPHNAEVQTRIENLRKAAQVR